MNNKAFENETNRQRQIYDRLQGILRRGCNSSFPGGYQGSTKTFDPQNQGTGCGCQVRQSSLRLPKFGKYLKK